MSLPPSDTGSRRSSPAAPRHCKVISAVSLKPGPAYPLMFTLELPPHLPPPPLSVTGVTGVATSNLILIQKAEEVQVG